MSGLWTSENFVFFLQFIVPGFIILYFRAQFTTGRLPPVAESLASCIILSTLYQAVVYPVHNLSVATPVSGAVIWIGVLFIIPAMIGVLLGVSVQKSWLRELFRKIGLNPVHPIDAAWDWHFAKAEECWGIVTLKTGKEFRGFLSKDSFMSTDPKERDILISMLYSQPEKEASWVSENSSLWIAHGEIQSIEFIPKERTTNVEETK